MLPEMLQPISILVLQSRALKREEISQ